jgi:hypothetical protein
MSNDTKPTRLDFALTIFIFVPGGILFVGTLFMQPYGESIEGVEVFLPWLFIDKLGPTFANYFLGVLLAVSWSIPASLIALCITKLFQRK